MAWKTMEVREQRVRFVVAALRREQSLSSLCREFEISRPTGQLWLERYRAGGDGESAKRWLASGSTSSPWSNVF